MKLDRLRNIGIIAHVDAGKTTLTERLLFASGETYQLGNVDSGNTVTDSSQQEKDMGITISSAAVSLKWKDCRINLIDTPGHVDFHVEVHRSLRVLDGAVVVFDGVSGVEPQTEANWRLADQYKVPRIALVNKMDRIGANFENVIRTIDQRLNANPVAVQIPIGEEDGFKGMIDLVSMQAVVFKKNELLEYEIVEIPKTLKTKANEFRAYLEEQVVELCEDAMLDWLSNQSLDNQVLASLVRQATIEGHIVPVLCASAYKNVGVQLVLDAIEQYLPSPSDVKSIIEAEDSLAALAFKVVNDKHGSLTYVRVYSGSINAGDKLYNASRQKMERVSRIYQMQANQRLSREVAYAGDIVALVGLRATTTGDSLCCKDKPVVLDSIEIPRSVIDVVIEAKSKADEEKLLRAITKLLDEDPSLKMKVNSLGQTVLSGLGELHLDIVFEKLKSDFKVNASKGQPQVAYREALTESTEVTYKHKKQGGGPGQYAVVKLKFEPIEGEDIQFENKIVGGAIPKEYVPAIESGIKQAAQSGILAGYPCGGFKATLIDGETHQNDSSIVAFQIAAKEAFKVAANQMCPVIMEPIMSVEVVTPFDYVGDCIGDLSKRRGKVVEQTMSGTDSIINALVPLASMFGFIGQLRSISAGRANFSMVFESYARLPPSQTELLVGGK